MFVAPNTACVANQRACTASANHEPAMIGTHAPPILTCCTDRFISIVSLLVASESDRKTWSASPSSLRGVCGQESTDCMRIFELRGHGKQRSLFLLTMKAGPSQPLAQSSAARSPWFRPCLRQAMPAVQLVRSSPTLWQDPHSLVS
jgi:hypothetical protein